MFLHINTEIVFCQGRFCKIVIAALNQGTEFLLKNMGTGKHGNGKFLFRQLGLATIVQKVAKT